MSWMTCLRLGAVTAMIAIVCAISVQPVRAGDLGSSVAITDQNYIATPSATGVNILLDVFQSEAALKAAPAAERATIAESLARRAVDLYLKELEDADRKAMKAADVSIVYIRQRDEYDKPMFSAMTEIGKVSLSLQDGKIAKLDKASEMKF